MDMMEGSVLSIVSVMKTDANYPFTSNHHCLPTCMNGWVRHEFNIY